MCKKTMCFVSLVLVLMTSAMVHAALQRVGNFDSLIGESPDGQACAGDLGGTWDTESEGTGSIDLVLKDGSKTVTISGHSNGESPRAIGFNDISNTIDNSESGIAFFRFMLRIYTLEPRTYMGFNMDTTTDPIDTWNANDPLSIPAGVQWTDNGAGGLNLLTLDGTTVLKADLPRSQWYNVWLVAHHATDTFDVYLSHAEGPAGEATLPTPNDLVKAGLPFTFPTTDPLTGVIVSNPGGGQGGQAERIYLDEFWWDGDQGLETPTQAKNPSPANNTQDVASDVVLSWKPSPSGVYRNVYLGENADDVANASVDDPRGVLVSLAQDANTYIPDMPLALGTPYYWRVDEVDVLAPDNPYVGTVWRFEVEPVAFALTQANITVTSSGSVDTEQIAENTVDGSGLGTDDGHGVDAKTMWLSSSAPNGAWIEYHFDRTYTLYDMSVWNHNSLNESLFGLGMKDVVVSYATDGATWTPIEGVTQFSRAPGRDGYQANTLIDLSGVVASDIRIDVSSNWVGFVDHFGFSELRFNAIPTSARLPQPESGTLDLDPTAEMILSWRAGRQATEHLLYLSTDVQAVVDGSVPPIPLTEAGYPSSDLDINAVYYWRVDEVNGADIWPGDIWEFSTVDSLVVDDFEVYTNDSPLLVFQGWVDGLGYFEDEYLPAKSGNGTGGLVGHDIWTLDSPHYLGTLMDRGNAHDGHQAMPLYYGNGEAPYVSEAIHRFDSAQDWTANGVDSLGIWYRGNPDTENANTPERLYAALTDRSGKRVEVELDAQGTGASDWTLGTVDLSAISESIDISRIEELAIGVGNGASGSDGLVLIDDVILFRAN